MLDELEAVPAQRTARAVERRKEQGLKTREKILDCALEAFAAHGFDGTKMREIASAAGVPHTLITHYFKTKDKLWREAVELMFNRLADELTLPSITASSEDRFKEFIRRYVRYCARHPEHARLMVQESVRGGERLNWAVEEFILPSHRRMAPRLLQQLENGSLPAVWPWSLAFMIAAMCQVPFTLAAEFKAVSGLDPAQSEVVEMHAEAVIAVLFGLRPILATGNWPPTPSWLIPED